MIRDGMRYATPQRDGRPVIGFGQAEIIAPAVTTSPWVLALTTSVVGAATGWVIEEVATRVRGKRKRR